MVDLLNRKNRRDRGDRIKIAGKVLILLGVSVWGVYALLRWGLGWSLSMKTFVAFHLMGVVPGSILRHWRLFSNRSR